MMVCSVCGKWCDDMIAYIDTSMVRDKGVMGVCDGVIDYAHLFHYPYTGDCRMFATV